jgi:uncharacterized membrane protein (UPF0127 family)
MAFGVLKKAGGEVVCARCELANTPLKRVRGLLGRSGLDDDEGMLFRPAGSIHMFFMRFAIDAVFCDRDLVVIGVERDLKPWKTARRKGAKVVIELAPGAAGELDPGDRLFLETATMKP